MIVRPATADDQKRPEAPLEMRLQWIKEIAGMGPDELTDFEARTFRQWDRASLGDLRRGTVRR